MESIWTYNRTHLHKEVNTQKTVFGYIQQFHHGILIFGIELLLGDGEMVYPFVEAEETACYYLLLLVLSRKHVAE